MRIFYNKDLLRAITGSDTPPQDFRSWLELGKKVRAYRPGLVHVAGARDNTIWLMPTLVNQPMASWILTGDHELRYPQLTTPVRAHDGAYVVRRTTNESVSGLGLDALLALRHRAQ